MVIFRPPGSVQHTGFVGCTLRTYIKDSFVMIEDLILLSGYETKKVSSSLHESVKSFRKNGSWEIQS